MDLFGIDTFILRIPGIDTVGFFMSCSGLELSVRRSTSTARAGATTSCTACPARCSYPNLVLSRGLTREDALLRWFTATQTKPSARRSR